MLEMALISKIIVSPTVHLKIHILNLIFLKTIFPVSINLSGKLCPEKGFYHLLDLHLRLSHFQYLFEYCRGDR